MIRNLTTLRRPLTIALSPALCATGHAAIITVNTLADSTGGSQCSLRGAIDSVNSGSAIGPGCTAQSSGTFGSNDTILFDFSLANSTVPLSQGQLSITAPAVIVGNGQTIDAGNNSRIFYVHPATPQAVTISGLTLTNGNAAQHSGGAVSVLGGGTFTLSNSTITGSTTGTAANAHYHGGAVYMTGGTLDIESSTFTNNTSNYSGGAIFGNNLVQATINQSTFESNAAGGQGGAVYLLAGAVLLTNSTIANNNNGTNSAGFDMGGGGALLRTTSAAATIQVAYCVVTGNTDHLGFGGGLYFSGSATVSHSTIANNQSLTSPGGGIVLYNASLTITDSTISGNTVSNSNGGGGIWGGNATLTMQRTLVSGNSAGYGGGLALGSNAYAGNSGVVIQDSTISHNSAVNGAAGIKLNSGANNSVALSNVTIAGNTTTGYGGGLYSDVGDNGVGGVGTGILTIESSTISDNRAGTAGGVFAASTGNPVTLHNSVVANNTATTDPDTSGSFTANFNVVLASGASTLTGSNNTTGVDPLLGSLGNYGGSTPTKLPKVGSPLIDAGDPAATTLTTDQRGLTRVVGAHIDIGADERQAIEDTIFLDGLEGY